METLPHNLKMNVGSESAVMSQKAIIKKLTS